MKKSLLTLILLAIILIGCKSPNDPEKFSESTGGYKIVSKTAALGFANDICIKDSLAFIAQGEGGLIIFNISDKQNPKFLSTVSDKIKGYSGKIIFKDSVVYISAGSFGVSVVNVSKPLYPEVTATNLPIKPAESFCIMGDYLFTAMREGGVNIAEISFRTQPDIRGSIANIPGYSQAAAISVDSNYLFVACGEMGMSMMNISDLQNGYGEYNLAGYFDTPGYAEDIVVHPTLPYLFMACGTAGLIVLDVSDSSKIKVAGKYSTGGYAKELIYNNSKIIISTETRGVQVIDVSNLQSPVKIATIETEFALGISEDAKHIYVADKYEGLIIIEKP